MHTQCMIAWYFDLLISLGVKPLLLLTSMHIWHSLREVLSSNMGAWGMWACSLFYTSFNWNSHQQNFDCVNSWNFTKSPPKFSAYVYCINPWEAAWMVVYIIVFILGSIRFKTESVRIDTKQQMTQSLSVPQQSLKDHSMSLQSQTIK